MPCPKRVCSAVPLTHCWLEAACGSLRRFPLSQQQASVLALTKQHARPGQDSPRRRQQQSLVLTKIAPHPRQPDRLRCPPHSHLRLLHESQALGHGARASSLQAIATGVTSFHVKAGPPVT